MEKEFLTTKEVAKLLKLSVPTIKVMLRDKKIPGYKVSGQWRFDKDEIIDWIKSGKAARED